MKSTSTMGLLYANVDAEKCVDCGLCLKMCPSANILSEKETITKEQAVGEVKSCCVGRSLNKDIFDNAQSGGMVTTILKYLFDNGLIDAAVSCRMEYGSPVPSLHYSVLTNAEKLYLNQKSCYTQVDIVSALKETAQYKSVAVVGVPCQIQGISNLTEFKKYSNITYKIGLVCDKTYSATYMDAIIKGIRKPKGDLRINYRQKNFSHKEVYYSYQQAPTVVLNREGHMAIIPNAKRMFLKDYFAVPKCRICWDKLNSKADIVLGDPWGLKGRYNEQEGDSLIITRSALGEKLLKELLDNSLVRAANVPINDVLEGQDIEGRVNKIKSSDWSVYQRAWERQEAMKKSDLLRKTQKEYRAQLKKTKSSPIIKAIRRYLRRIKKVMLHRN